MSNFLQMNLLNSVHGIPNIRFFLASLTTSHRRHFHTRFNYISLIMIGTRFICFPLNRNLIGPLTNVHECLTILMYNLGKINCLLRELIYFQLERINHGSYDLCYLWRHCIIFVYLFIVKIWFKKIQSSQSKYTGLHLMSNLFIARIYTSLNDTFYLIQLIEVIMGHCSY